MATAKGKIALMGSGELTPTMVEVHKELLDSLAVDPQAVFLDTPAGFQLNVDQICAKAVEYFDTRVGHPLTVASYKSDTSGDYESQAAFQTLRRAGYTLIGPGSPTYALRQFKGSPIPDIFSRRVNAGGCLVAASAAALTVGRFTLPVYEIYKVGEDLHWVDGLDILSRFGLNLVVVPHWNNAEGGTHDTSCCFMGKSRFAQLVDLLPEDVAILGLDEHTACIMDMEHQEVVVKGIGQVTWRRADQEVRFDKNDRFSLDLLRDGPKNFKTVQPAPAATEKISTDKNEPSASWWDRIHAIEEKFQNGLQQHEPEQVTSALLELDRMIWQGHEARESEEFIAQAREVLRDQIVLLGSRLASSPKDETECLLPVIEELLALRERFRAGKQWAEADAIRDSLERSQVTIEDTAEGTRWHINT